MNEASASDTASLLQGLVVEDLPASAVWLCDVLEEVFPDMVVRQADCVESGRKTIDAAVPQLALIDLGLPDGSGIELIRKLAHGGQTPHIIVSTIYADDRHLFPALRAGATGYLLKDQSRDRVIKSLRGIAAGEPPLSPRVAQRLLRIFAHEHEEPEVPLSPREREVLTLIAKGFRLPDVAESMGVTRNTAAGYVKAVYRKLNISSRAEAAPKPRWRPAGWAW